MKKIGLVGGLSPTSTKIFYTKLIDMGFSKHGENPEIIIYSVDLYKYLNLLNSENADLLAHEFSKVITSLEIVGAEICTITSLSMNIAYKDLKVDSQVEVLNLLEILVSNISSRYPIILGTRFIVQNDLLVNYLKAAGINYCIPNEKDCDLIEQIIKNELNVNKVKETSKDTMIGIVNKYVKDGVDGVVIACTALPLILSQDDFSLPVYDVIEIACQEIINKI